MARIGCTGVRFGAFPPRVGRDGFMCRFLGEDFSTVACISAGGDWRDEADCRATSTRAARDTADEEGKGLSCSVEA